MLQVLGKYRSGTSKADPTLDLELHFLGSITDVTRPSNVPCAPWSAPGEN